MRTEKGVFLLAATVVTVGSVSFARASQPKRILDQATNAFNGTQRVARANVHGAAQAASRLNQATTRSMGHQFNRAASQTTTSTSSNTWRPSSVSSSSASLNRRTPSAADDTVRRQQERRRQQAQTHQAKQDQEKRRQKMLGEFDLANEVPNKGFQGNSTNQTLRPGMVIDRYGRPEGLYVSPAGTPKSARSLNRSPNRPAYNMYVVQKPISNTKVGPIAPARGQPGGGTQMILPEGGVQKQLDNGSIRVAKPTDANYAKNNFNGNAQP